MSFYDNQYSHLANNFSVKLNSEQFTFGAALGGSKIVNALIILLTRYTIHSTFFERIAKRFESHFSIINNFFTFLV